ncbi:MAG: hypothetical protein RL343_473 [Actinomycetota bacterium]|jgi:uncharacterized membrane protein YeaQ/YmgE (transglycosylase-associated protein family)
MAKETKKTKNRAARPQGQIAQMWTVYKMTAQQDKTSTLWAALSFLLVLGAFIAFTTISFPGNVVNLVVFIIMGALFGIIAAMFVMGRKAERAAYNRIAGQMGAVGAVLGNIRKGWRSAEMPVAVNPRSQDAVYRAIGPAGVVLVGEGARTRVKVLLEDERRKVNRVAPGAPVNFLFVTNDAEATQLADLTKTLYKMKKSLNRAEIGVVAKRLESLGLNIPIPKGIDPSKMGKMRRG